MIQVNNIKKEFGEQLLFEEVSMIINPRERLGLVGRNGSGKSTFFKIVLGELTPDGGEVVIPKGYKIGSLSQHIRFTEKTVLEECMQGLSIEEQFDQYKAEKILFGLGFGDDDLSRDPWSFSGGYQVRLNLAKTLLQAPNLLLLDEPTNYLDIVSLRWLQRFLKNFPGEVLLITHDRHFMDAVTTHTIGISRQRVRKIKGGTHNYYQQIQLEEELYEQTRVNQDKKRKELEGFVERFKAKASKAAQAQSRMKQLEKMEVYDKLSEERRLQFQFRYKECPGKRIMEARNISFAYPQGSELFSDLSFTIDRKDRVAIIGKNGKGKSTLLNTMAGLLKHTEGELQFHPQYSLGHFGQTNVERLSGEMTIEEEIFSSNESLSRSEVRGLAGLMMFEGDLARKKIKVLSGGEKSRVLLAKILSQQTNLLFLDEPTNHLDMDSVESLIQALEKYQGALLIVTHNEEMIKRLATKLIVFHRSGAECFQGNYEDFLEKIGWESEKDEAAVVMKKPKSAAEKKRLRGELVLERAREIKPLQEKMEKLEEIIVKFEEILSKKQIELNLAAEKQQNHLIPELSKSYGEFSSKVDELFNELSSVSETLTNKEQDYEARLKELE